MSYLIEFDKLSWDELATGVRLKAFVSGNQQIDSVTCGIFINHAANFGSTDCQFRLKRTVDFGVSVCLFCFNGL